MTTQAANDETFRDALRKGLGRAHLMLAEDSSDGRGEVLADACVDDFDYGWGDSWAQYLVELIGLTPDRDVIVDRIRDRLASGTHDGNVRLHIEIGRLLSHGGAVGFREPMRRTFETYVDRVIETRHDPSQFDGLAEEMIALDPIQGALLAAQQLGRLALNDPDFRYDNRHIMEAWGAATAAGEVEAALSAARQADTMIGAYLRRVELHHFSVPRPSPNADARQRIRGLAWPDAQAVIEDQILETGAGTRIGLGWSHDASDADILAAAHALVELPTGDVNRLRSYLPIFQMRTFPLDPRPLLALIDSADGKLALSAARALAMVTHPAVRERALAMAAAGPLQDEALRLLARNWRPGDEEIAERLLRETTDPEDLDNVGIGLRLVSDVDLSPTLVPALLLAYELSPCPLCRGDFVEKLISLDALPTSLREECRWDCSEEIRQLVQPNSEAPTLPA